MAAAYSNRALVHLKLSQPEAAEADCNNALELAPSNVKALLRRAAARSASTAGPVLQPSADACPRHHMTSFNAPHRICGSCSNVAPGYVHDTAC